MGRGETKRPPNVEKPYNTSMRAVEIGIEELLEPWISRLAEHILRCSGKEHLP